MESKAIFVDTGFWIALINRNDALHKQALALKKRYAHTRLVTTEMVLTELLNGFSKFGQPLKQFAADLVDELRESDTVTIVDQSSSQFQAGLILYKQMKDKKWSHTDCTSFLVMREHGLTEALTPDHHFSQAHFIQLL